MMPLGTVSNGKLAVSSIQLIANHEMDDLEREQAFLNFFDKADLIIFDTMYTFAEALTMKEDWGH